MIFLKAELVARTGTLGSLLDVLTNGLFPIVEHRAGWRLQGCFVHQTGRLETVVDLWELHDHAAFAIGSAALRTDPAYPDVRARLDRCIESETLVFLGAHAGRLAATEI